MIRPSDGLISTPAISNRISTHHVPLVLIALKLSQDDYHSPRLPRQLTVLISTSKDDHVWPEHRIMCSSFLLYYWYIFLINIVVASALTGCSAGWLLLTLISVLHVRYRKATGYTLQGWLFLYNLASDSVLIFATLRLGPESLILVPLISNSNGSLQRIQWKYSKVYTVLGLATIQVAWLMSLNRAMIHWHNV